MNDNSARREATAYFLAFCVELYKNSRQIPGSVASQLLSEKGVLGYLRANYEALHSQSHHWILEEIEGKINQANQANA